MSHGFFDSESEIAIGFRFLEQAWFPEGGFYGYLEELVEAGVTEKQVVLVLDPGLASLVQSSVEEAYGGANNSSELTDLGEGPLAEAEGRLER